MDVQIVRERPDSVDGVTLIGELDAYLNEAYPEFPWYGYTVAQLVADNVAFFVARCDGRPAGCGGIKFYGKEWGEVKRVFVRPEYRRLKLGAQIMRTIESCAIENGILLVRLEAGARQPEALAFYRKLGYTAIPAYPPFVDDDLGAYFEKRLG